jgi:capsular polysaccharide transport system ATP-binding protein
MVSEKIESSPVLAVRGLAKSYPRAGRPRFLFQDLSFNLQHSDRLAIIGRNGQGKSTLIKILGGVLSPSRGDVRWTMSASWPLGYGGAFQGGLTGTDNVKFIARIYNRPIDQILEKVEKFAELEDAMTMPVKHYSTGMRARLAFGLTLAIEFDCYLIDEVISVGDVSFRQKCQEELFDKRRDRCFIIASHDLEFLRQTCNCAIVINDGHAEPYSDMDAALSAYDEICGSI